VDRDIPFRELKVGTVRGDGPKEGQ
jgi:hypothetical protein